MRGASRHRENRVPNAVKKRVREFVRSRVHTNHTESLGTLSKRGYPGTYSAMNLHRNIDDFVGRRRDRPLDIEGLSVANILRLDRECPHFPDRINATFTPQLRVI